LKKLAVALLFLALQAGCSSGGSSPDAIADAVSESVADSAAEAVAESVVETASETVAIPWMPPAYPDPVKDEPFLQEYNHTSNQVEPGIGPLVAVLGAITVAYLIFHPSTRYRAPADPFVFVLAALSVTRLAERLRTR